MEKQLVEWISVKDQKPNNGEMVLVDCEYGVTLGEYYGHENRDGYWWVVKSIGTYEDFCEAERVTHWMRKPQRAVKTEI